MTDHDSKIEDSDMIYKCQQCSGEATVRGTQAIDQYESPYIAEYVICEVCGYTISKDAADCAELLKACKMTATNLVTMLNAVRSGVSIRVFLCDSLKVVETAITKAEQTGD